MFVYGTATSNRGLHADRTGKRREDVAVPFGWIAKDQGELRSARKKALISTVL